MKKNLLLFGLLTAAFSACAQAKFGDNNSTINSNSLVEMESTNKGLLLPRLALTGIVQASPLSAHIAGMTVYNTATAGTAPNNVTPGLYYNDGTQWVRIGGATAGKNLTGAKVSGTANLINIVNGTGATLTDATVQIDTIQLGSTINNLYNNSGSPIAAKNVTAGSNKVTLGGTPLGAVLKPFSVDVNEDNLNLNNIGGTLNLNKISNGGATNNQVLTFNTTTNTWIAKTPDNGAADGDAWGVNGEDQSSNVKRRGAVTVEGADSKGAISLSPGSSTQAGYLGIIKGDGATRLGYIGYDNTDLTYVSENGAKHSFLNTAPTIASFSHNNLTQGVGITYSGVYKTGTNVNGDLELAAKGTGNILLGTAGSGVTPSSTGNVGIGLTNPATKLTIYNDVKGAIQIIDGTQGANKVLTSDANGVGEWKPIHKYLAFVNSSGSRPSKINLTSGRLDISWGSNWGAGNSIIVNNGNITETGLTNTVTILSGQHSNNVLLHFDRSDVPGTSFASEIRLTYSGNTLTITPNNTYFEVIANYVDF